MRVSIDVHGVITRWPDFFKQFTLDLINNGCEVFVCTGQEMGIALIRELDSYKVLFHEILSVTTYHRSIGTSIIYKNGDPTQPQMADALWEPTKAILCQNNHIDLHIDDSDVYEMFFTGYTEYVNVNRFENLGDLYRHLRRRIYG